MKIVKKIQLKIVIFTAMKNRCILHGRVFVIKTVRNSCLIANCCLTTGNSIFNCKLSPIRDKMLFLSFLVRVFTIAAFPVG